MLKIIRTIISLHLILYGILISIVAINFLLITIASSANLIALTPEMSTQILTYAVNFTSAVMLIMLIFGIIAFAITEYNHKLRSQKLPHDQSERKHPKHANARHQQK